MANLKISDLTPKGAPIDPTDLFEVSVFNGIDYDTFSVSGADFPSGGGGGGFFGNETATVDSTKDFATFSMQWIGLGEFYAEATNAPTVGNASFEWQGFGTLGSDLVQTIKNGAGTVISDLRGNGQVAFGSLNAIYKASITSGPLNGLYVESSASLGFSAFCTNNGGQIQGVNVGLVLIGGEIGATISGKRGLLADASTSESTTNRAVIGLGGGYFESFGINGTPETSSILEARSITKGSIPAPKMTTAQRDLIPTPVSGLMVYNTTTNKLQCYDGTIWNDLF